MLANSLKIAARNILRHKGYAFINVVGLSVGISVCFLIFLWVRDELGYDRFHAKAGRIYRALWHGRFGDNEWKTPLVGVPLADALAKEFPEVEQVVRLYKGGLTLRHGDDYVREADFVFAEESFFEVFTVSFISGNPATSLHDPEAVVLTEETAQRYFPDQNPLGQMLTRNDGKLMRVTAVVKSFPPQSHFHFESLHHEVKPILFFLARWEPSYFAVRLHPGNLAEGVAAIQNLWKEFVPNTPFQYSFLDQDYQKLYESEQGVGRVFMTFSALAILIACLGLFGLASFTAEQRTKEIGIRKVLGATVAGIIGLLSKDFAKLVFAAFIVAIPLAYFAMQRWLQNFAYRTAIDWWVFVLAGGMALLIALLTVSTQAIKAALANPVDSLRHE